MDYEDLFVYLTMGPLPKGNMKARMFELHNSLYGKSRYIRSVENPKTFCGSCIQRVKANLWKWYHFDESAPNYDSIVFDNRMGIHNMPIYIQKKYAK